MEFTIHKAEFVKALSTTQGVCEKKSTLEVLTGVYIGADKKKGLTVAATDLAVGVIGSYVADVKTQGSVVLQGAGLADIIRGLPSDEVKVKLQDNLRVTIKAGKAEYKLSAKAGDDFPKLPTPDTANMVELDSSLFLDMIDKTLYAVSLDETRAHLAGAYLVRQGDTLKMVSTDGHRLSIVSRPSSSLTVDVKEGVIIPRKGLIEAKKFLAKKSDSTSIGVQGSNVYLTRDGVTLSVKLIDAQYPDFAQVVPTKSANIAIIHRGQFADVLKRVSLLSPNGDVKLSLDKGSLDVSSRGHDNEAQESFDVEYKGASMSIGFNARYIQEALGATSSQEILLAINDEISPCLITAMDDAGYNAVIMPVRL